MLEMHEILFTRAYIFSSVVFHQNKLINPSMGDIIAIPG